MLSVWNILTLVGLLSFFTFVAFFGRLPGLRKTPIGFLHRVIWIHLPKFFGAIDRVLTGGRLAGSVSRTWNHLLYEKHPVVLIFFLSLVTGGAALLVPAVWPYINGFQKLLIPVLLPLPYYFTYLCNITNASSPHIVTRQNFVEHVTKYPYDYKLFHPNIACRTCDIPKPARSKHCSLCRACVARADHHCIWVNNCLGRGNYKYFIALLLGTHLLLVFGAHLAYSTLKPEVQLQFQKYPQWHMLEFHDRTDLMGRMLANGEWILDVLSTAFMIGGVARGGVGFMAFLTAPLPLGLLLYHVYLIWAGMTTNESGKWSDWKEDMNDNVVFITEFDSRHSWTYEPYPDEQGYDRHMWKASQWPKRSDQCMVITRDGRAPMNVQPQIAEVVGEAQWKRAKQLKYVDNIYDLGFWENLKHMMTN